MSYKLQIQKCKLPPVSVVSIPFSKVSNWKDFNMTTKYCCCHTTEFLPKHVTQALDSVLLKLQTKQPTIFVHF